LALAGGGAPVPFLQGRGVIEPSVGPDGWVWAASSDVDGALRLATYDGTEIQVAADWLTGQDVVALSVARDGARVAIVTRNTEGVQVDVVGVVRDDAGTPRQLTAPTSVGAALLTV